MCDKCPWPIRYYISVSGQSLERSRRSTCLQLTGGMSFFNIFLYIFFIDKSIALLLLGFFWGGGVGGRDRGERKKKKK